MQMWVSLTVGKLTHAHNKTISIKTVIPVLYYCHFHTTSNTLATTKSQTGNLQHNW